MINLYLKITRKLVYILRRVLFKMMYVPYTRTSKVKVYTTEKPVKREFNLNRDYVVVTEVVCQHSIHEWNKYPRPGIRIMKLKPYDVIRFEGVYENARTKYYRFKRYSSPGVLENYNYDIGIIDAKYGIRETSDLTGGW